VLTFEAGVLVEDEIVMERIYSNQLNELAMDMVPSLLFEVNAAHLHEFDSQLYLMFVYFPAEMISCFDAVLRELFQRFFVEPETNEATRVQRMIKRELILVSLKRLRREEQHTLRDLGPQHIGRLVSLQGIVIRMSEIHPEMKRAHFRCGKCKATVDIDLENARVR
jgi:DNA replication licensing factor MCM4